MTVMYESLTDYLDRYIDFYSSSHEFGYADKLYLHAICKCGWSGKVGVISREVALTQYKNHIKYYEYQVQLATVALEAVDKFMRAEVNHV